MPRGLKKFLYGLLYLAVFAVLAWRIYVGIAVPAPSCSDGKRNQTETDIDCGGPCVSCVLRELAPLRVDDVEFFRTDGGDVAVLGALANPNEAYDGEASYTVAFVGERGETVATTTAVVSVPAHGVRRTYDVYREHAGTVVAADVKIGSVAWEEAGAPRPSVTAFGPRAVVESGRIVVHGTVANQGLARADDIIVIAVIADRNGFPLFASKTFIERLDGGNSKEFVVLFPKSETLADTFDAENIALYVDIP